MELKAELEPRESDGDDSDDSESDSDDSEDSGSDGDSDDSDDSSDDEETDEEDVSHHLVIPTVRERSSSARKAVRPLSAFS